MPGVRERERERERERDLLGTISITIALKPTEYVCVWMHMRMCNFTR